MYTITIYKAQPRAQLTDKTRKLSSKSANNIPKHYVDHTQLVDMFTINIYKYVQAPPLHITWMVQLHQLIYLL